jgi:hypothetical protein
MLSYYRQVHQQLVDERQRRGKGFLGRFGPATFESADLFFARKFTQVVVWRSLEPRKTVAIGDLHGDITVLWVLLYETGCIDRDGNWIGRSSVVLQVGDFLDRGGRFDADDNPVSVPSGNPREELDIMQYAWFLNEQAAEFGGQVILLSGNHEYMNFQHDFSCTSPENLEGWGGLAGRIAWFRTGTDFATQYFAKRHPVMIQFGRIVCVHGGLGSPCEIKGDHDSFQNYLLSLNASWTAYLRSRQKDVEVSQCVLDVLYSRTLSNNFSGTEEQCDNVATALFEQVGLGLDSVLCIGHTPQVRGYQPQHGVNGVCGNSVFRVDLASSAAFGESNRPQQALAITVGPDNELEFEVVSTSSPKSRKV